jgi:hypothetical protein
MVPKNVIFFLLKNISPKKERRKPVKTVVPKTFQPKIVLVVGGVWGWGGGMGDRCNYSMTETFYSPSCI